MKHNKALDDAYYALSNIHVVVEDRNKTFRLLFFVFTAVGFTSAL